MSGIELTFSQNDIATVIMPRVARLAELDTGELLDTLGSLGASQTKTRIEEEKTSPDGEAWKPNLRGGSILFFEGHLADSIAHHVDGDEVAWGSNRVYAAIHQNGGDILPRNGDRLHFTIGKKHFTPKKVTMPKRAYLGFSAANKDEIVKALNAWIAEVLQ